MEPGSETYDDVKNEVLQSQKRSHGKVGSNSKPKLNTKPKPEPKPKVVIEIKNIFSVSRGGEKLVKNVTL